MGGEAVPQRMNADTLGDAGTPRCQANDPMQLARTCMLPAVAGKQPGLTGRHPALLARDAPPFMCVSSDLIRQCSWFSEAGAGGRDAVLANSRDRGPPVGVGGPR